MNRRIFVLGSTGSIGRSTIEVIEHLRSMDGAGHWSVAGLSARCNAKLLSKQAKLLDVDAVSLEVDHAVDVQHVYVGINSAVDLIREHARQGDLVVAAIVGFAGIAPVLAAIELGCDIALANKEALVAGGKLVMDAAKAAGVRILPVDSEHSAIFQALGSHSNKEISKLILTASGGSLRDMPTCEMGSATREQVLSHPTWKMGEKVTVDSASLMNKAMELIEAHWLFDVDSDRLEAIIHPQSIVHGLVEFRDGSVVAQLSSPDMRLPIQYALTWPDRVDGCCTKVNWSTLGSLDFQPLDPVRFPAIQLAYDVIKQGGTAGAIFNGANEVAVTAFLDHRLSFGSMVGIVQQVLGQVAVVENIDMEVLFAADAEARSAASTIIDSVRENV